MYTELRNAVTTLIDNLKLSINLSSSRLWFGAILASFRQRSGAAEAVGRAAGGGQKEDAARVAERISDTCRLCHEGQRYNRRDEDLVEKARGIRGPPSSHHADV
ncbi:hypothetical protein K438DRAFT_1764886 [Mycena galopus ATCC 62051]|nr:hypothetical protein K438DRAFT_1764886 [Mycena galopus ATCC 62051]